MALPGRPRLSDAERAVQICVRLRPNTLDTIYRYANHRGEQAGPLIRTVLERVFRHLEMKASTGTCYGASQRGSESTMGTLLAASPTQSASRVAEPGSPR